MTEEEVLALCSKEGRQALATAGDVEASDFVLQHKLAYPQQLLRAVAEQIACRSLLAKKHPALPELLVERSLLEQSTPSVVAAFRASLLGEGAVVVDGTGGLGIDIASVAPHYDSAVYCEMDPARVALFRANQAALGLSAVAVQSGDSMAYVSALSEPVDLLFLDPARRDSQKRFATMDQYSPDVCAHWSMLLQRAKRVAVKLSPMTDIASLLKQFSSVEKIVVISLDGEVKELLLLASAERSGAVAVEAICLKREARPYRCVVDASLVEPVAAVGELLCIPDAAIRKARAETALLREFDLSLLSLPASLLTGHVCAEGFPGRVITVDTVVPWQRKSVKRFLKQRDITAATIVSREFPLKAKELRTQLKLAESARVYLLFTTLCTGERVMIYGERR